MSAASQPVETPRLETPAAVRYSLRWMFGWMLIAAAGFLVLRSLQPRPLVLFRTSPIDGQARQRLYFLQHTDGSWEEYRTDLEGRLTGFSVSTPDLDLHRAIVEQSFERLRAELRRQEVSEEDTASHFKRPLAELPRDWPRVNDPRGFDSGRRGLNREEPR